jgi:N-acetylneuraminate lyase
MGGAQGGISGTGNYIGKVLVGVIDEFNKGNIEKARELQNFAQKVINVIVNYRGNIVGGKRIMKLIGIDLGINRTPFQNMNGEEELIMKRNLEEINFFEKCNKL